MERALDLKLADSGLGLASSARSLWWGLSSPQCFHHNFKITPRPVNHIFTVLRFSLSTVR